MSRVGGLSGVVGRGRVNPGWLTVACMSESAAPVTTRGDIERLCWRLSGWQVDQAAVDRLLLAVDAYVAGAPVPAEIPAQESAPASQEPVTAPVAQEPARLVVEPDAAVQGFEGAYVLTVSRIDRPEPQGRPLPRADTEEPMRKCRKCGTVYPIQMYNRDPYGRGGRKTACGPCENKRKREARRLSRAAARTAKAA